MGHFPESHGHPNPPEEDVLLDALGVLSRGKRKWRYVPSEVT